MKIKFPPKKKISEIKNFFKKKGLLSVLVNSRGKNLGVNELKSKEPYMPDLNDLYRLYQFVILNKRTTILEFGSGWSSLIFYLALSELKSKFKKQVEKLRRNNPFELFILENERKFLNISKKRIKLFIKKNVFKEKSKINYNFSAVEMTTFNKMICTRYKKIPLCNPDFIYLDGPDQFNVKGNVSGISTRHGDMMPMSSDILRMEYYYIPGTIIICDGRSANAKFLKDNLKRNWKYVHDRKNDQHIFWLCDPILGKINQKQINFYNS